MTTMRAGFHYRRAIASQLHQVQIASARWNPAPKGGAQMLCTNFGPPKHRVGVPGNPVSAPSFCLVERLRYWWVLGVFDVALQRITVRCASRSGSQRVPVSRRFVLPGILWIRALCSGGDCHLSSTLARLMQIGSSELASLVASYATAWQQFAGSRQVAGPGRFSRADQTSIS